MALLIGTETEGAGAEPSPGEGRATACIYEALLTGTVERLHAKFPNNGTGTSANISIHEDDSGKPKNPPLVEGVLSSTTAGPHESELVSVPITKGTKYWIAVQPVGGSLKLKRGSTTAEYKNKTAKAKISEVTWDEPDGNVGPMSFWGTGTETGGVTLEMATKVKLKGSDAPTQRTSLGLTSKVSQRDSAVVASTAETEGSLGHPKYRPNLSTEWDSFRENAEWTPWFESHFDKLLAYNTDWITEVPTRPVVRYRDYYIDYLHGTNGEQSGEASTEAKRKEYTKDVEEDVFGPYKGVNSHSTWQATVTEAQAKHEIEEAVALGVKSIRVPVQWREIESSEGVRGGAHLTRLDLVINEASAAGIKVQGTIATTPAWASGGSGEKLWNWAPSNADASVKPFAKWLTERYGSKLEAVGCWNEPEQEPEGIPNFKSPSGASFPKTEKGRRELAWYYVKFVKAVYTGAKEGNASIKVLAMEGGENAGQNIGSENQFPFFLKACWAGGEGPAKETQTGISSATYDAIALHAYSEGTAPESTNEFSTKSKVERQRALMVAQEGTAVPIWVNEWGWSNENSEATNATYVEQGIPFLNGLSYVEGWAYYQLRDTSEGEGAESNFGLLKLSFAQRLAYTAFKMAPLFAGPWLGDINFGGTNRPKPTTQEILAWQEELASLLEEVRAAVGLEVPIHIGSEYRYIYPGIREEATVVLRLLEQVSSVAKDFGVGYNTSWTTGALGENKNKLKGYFEYVDWLHEHGIQIELTGAGPASVSQAEFEYHLAVYFLGNAQAINLAGRPALGGDYLEMSQQYPLGGVTLAEWKTKESSTVGANKWWTGLDIDIGEPLEARKHSQPSGTYVNGRLWERRYTNALVYASDPGAEEVTITLPAGTWTNIKGEVQGATIKLKSRTVESTALGSGAILLGETAEPQTLAPRGLLTTRAKLQLEPVPALSTLVPSGAQAAVAQLATFQLSATAALARRYDLARTYASGPINPWLGGTTDEQEMSLYATYTVP